MYKLIKNEFLKEVKKKKTVIMLITLVAVMLFSNLYALNSRKDASSGNRIKQNQKHIDDLKLNLEKSSNENDKKNIENKIKEVESLNSELQFQIDNKELGWRTLAEKKIAALDSSLDKLGNNEDEQRETLEISRKMYQICLDKNIEPAFYGDNSGAFNLIIDIIRLLSMFLIPIFAVIIISDSISGEFNPMTIRMMLVRPVSKAKIYLSKFIALNILTVGSVILMETINFLILGIALGFGSPELPSIVGGRYQDNLLNGVSLVHGSIYLLPIWKVLIGGIGMQMLYIICACAFIMMISTISKNSILSISISFIVCVGISIFTNVISRSNMELIKNLYSYIFAAYFDGISVLTGDLSRLMKNPNISVSSSIFTITMQLIIFYLIGMLMFNRKEKAI